MCLLSCISCFSWLNYSFGYDHLGAAEDEFGLLAGVAALALLGDEVRPHALGAGAADALVQGRVVRGADDRVIRVDAMTQERRLDLARLDLDGLGPALEGVPV